MILLSIVKEFDSLICPEKTVKLQDISFIGLISIVNILDEERPLESKLCLDSAYYNIVE